MFCYKRGVLILEVVSLLYTSLCIHLGQKQCMYYTAQTCTCTCTKFMWPALRIGTICRNGSAIYSMMKKANIFCRKLQLLVSDVSIVFVRGERYTLHVHYTTFVKYIQHSVH